MATRPKRAAKTSNGSSPSEPRASNIDGQPAPNPQDLRPPWPFTIGVGPEGMPQKVNLVEDFIRLPPNEDNPRRGDRNKSQAEALKQVQDPKKHQIDVQSSMFLFDDKLGWAYRRYQVQPEQFQKTSGGERQFQPHLYLFNVLVALEWKPSDRYMRMLKRAFKRASDFLYDTVNTRSIHADARYMLWVMTEVDGASHLVKEMGIR